MQLQTVHSKMAPVLALRMALLLSALLHAGFVVWVKVRPAPSSSATTMLPDRWAGTGIEIDATALTETAAASGAEQRPKAATARESSQEEAVRAPETATKAAVPATDAPEPTPQPSRRVRPTPPASASSSSASASAPSAPSADTASVATASAAPGGTFGAAGLPQGVRHLALAFVRALPVANRSDPRWRELALGTAAEVSIRLTVAGDGSLAELEYTDARERDALRPVVRKLLDNTVLLLRAGRFSLDPRAPQSGSQELRIAVEVAQREAPSEGGDPTELFGLGSVAPAPGKPGRSRFTLNSGREITVWVALE